jgi:transposase-like protein
VDTLKLSPEVLKMPKSRPPYSPEFRRQMVDLVHAGRDPDDLAREFEPTGQSIRAWVAKADQQEGQDWIGARWERLETDELDAKANHVLDPSNSVTAPLEVGRGGELIVETAERPHRLNFRGAHNGVRLRRRTNCAFLARVTAPKAFPVESARSCAARLSRVPLSRLGATPADARRMV